MKAKQLPSGAWRCRVYLGKDENGKQMFQSFVDPDKKHCEALAHDFADQVRGLNKKHTFRKALIEYLAMKKPVLSPVTFRGYKSLERNMEENFPAFMNLPCRAVDTRQIQQLINRLSLTHSPKTISNYVGLVSAVLSFQDVPMPKYHLPKKIRKQVTIPTSEDVKKVVGMSDHYELRIPIMLAAFGTLRRSEIAALVWPDDFSGNTVRISKGMVKNDRGEWIVKAPKTLSSNRSVELPGFVVEEIRKQGYVTKLSPDQITNRFLKLISKAEVPHFSFHKLRHYSATVALGMGVPLNIVEDRGGWEHGSSTLQRVYTHVLDEQRKKETEKINGYFESLL